ncbi:YwqG family protein [Nocardioides speluncae]|uniref:YwqG family protein n=1 Tax=Nocardioides speluncae TaxID=2670337 RepID=UPI000D68D907|nr:YwqG family protein [Nocardioides speluncae]
MLRPAIQLTTAHPGDPIVARIGGRPRLPTDVEWPEWDGHGPLSFIAEVDLGALAQLGLDAGIPLPKQGYLSCFYFDGTYDENAGIVSVQDTDSMAGARMLHLEGDGVRRARRAADRVPVFEERLLTGQQIMTAPSYEHRTLVEAFGTPGQDYDEWLAHPINAEPFTKALAEMRGDGEPLHQIGGWAAPEQEPVELDAAHAALELGSSWDDARVEREAERWTLLLQVDSDGDMCWGDVGKLYWLARHDDLAADKLTDTAFTWQSGAQPGSTAQ